MDEVRPDPESLLREALREGRGRLKIFLGAAPGVGKTYAMLEAGQQRRREGIDVVAGIIETHGRAETAALVEGLEVLPARQLRYRDREFQELDLDAVLARRPALALVDELAHSNVPGSRHLKRHQDVAELIGAGIDVYTTLNVQHLESLNDVVAKISGVRVRETLPDHVVDNADEIELVDLPPDELIQRLRDGKIYRPDQARSALDQFFGRGNLIALRELAMRTAAERVDADVRRYLDRHSAQGPWPTRDRLIVGVGGGADGRSLVRSAARIAEARRLPWIAVHVIDSRANLLPDRLKDRIAETLRLAEQLGAETVTIPGEAVAEELLAYARSRNATQIVLGRSPKRPWFRLWPPGVGQQLFADAKDFDVTVVAQAEPRPGESVRPTPPPGPGDWSLTRRAAVETLLGVAAATALSALLEHLLPPSNLSLVYLVVVLQVALRHGQAAALAASVLSFITLNLLFTDPRLSLSVSRSEEWLTLLFFMLIALLAGRVASQVRGQMSALRKTARRTSNLADLSRRLAGSVDRGQVCRAIVEHVRETVGCSCLVITEEPGPRLLPAARVGISQDYQFRDIDQAAATWCWQHRQPAGWSSATLPGSSWLFVPLETARGIAGALGIKDERKRPFSAGQRRLLDALCDQAAVALERVALGQELERSRLTSETESLRSALLSSVSHDLRTPLVSIIGSAHSLLDPAAPLPPPARDTLVQTVLDEAERLNRFVQNLLDMTRLGYGGPALNPEWCDLRELASDAIRGLARVLEPHRLDLDFEAELPLVRVDPILIRQVLVNLLDNAAKYAPPGTAIRIEGRAVGTQLRVRVIDQGPGIPLADREAVFDSFYRVRDTDRRVAGTGLGLSICRGLVAAHGGTIRALAAPDGRGACLEVMLPIEPMPSSKP